MSGAMMRSRCKELAGCAAGHRSRPSEAGAARAPEEAQDIAFASGGKTEPAAHASQTPEQVEFMRPALPPKVPAGQSEQEAAPAVAKVPGAQGAHTPAPLGTEPAGHNCAAVTETETARSTQGADAGTKSRGGTSAGAKSSSRTQCA